MINTKNNLIKIFEDSVRQGADMIILKSTKEFAPAEIHLYFTESNDSPIRLEYNGAHELGDFNAVTKAISEISIPKKDLSHYINEDLLGDQNILIYSKLKQLFLGRITKNSNITTKENSIQIFIKKSGFSSIFDFLTVSPRLNELPTTLKKSNPIILYNGTNKLNHFILSSLFPGSIDLSLNLIGENKTLISNQSSAPLLVSHNFDDPVDGLFAYIESVKNLDITEIALENLTASLVIKPLRKQCGICSKPTAISTETRERFPVVYQSKIPKVYQFSRGCKNCGFTSYKGMMTIESLFEVSSSLKTKLKEINDPSLAYSIYNDLNIKTIFEDAIEKVRNGQISVEEVSQNLPQISNAFSKFLNTSWSPSNKSQQTPTILVIEDDLNQRDVLELVFRKEGYNVLTAENGKIAIENLKNNDVSVIVSDIMMPEMNGLEFLKYCKSSQIFKEIPILMLTASANPDHELTMLDEGADDYCPKNSKKKVLLKRVEKLVTRSNSNNNPLKHLTQD